MALGVLVWVVRSLGFERRDGFGFVGIIGLGGSFRRLSVAAMLAADSRERKRKIEREREREEILGSGQVTEKDKEADEIVFYDV